MGLFQVIVITWLFVLTVVIVYLDVTLCDKIGRLIAIVERLMYKNLPKQIN